MCMVGVAQLVEHLVVVQVAAGSSPVTHPMVLPRRTQTVARSPSWGPGHRHVRPRSSRAVSSTRRVRCRTMGRMLMGNKKAQRITVGVIIGVMVVSLALSLISSASATP